MKHGTARQDARQPHHTAIILDGNGRWAEARGFPRASGHRAGAAAVRRTVEAARGLSLRLLTLYAFSSDNWKRPRPEVNALFALLKTYLVEEAERLRKTAVLSGKEELIRLREEWEVEVRGRREEVEREERRVADDSPGGLLGCSVGLLLAPNLGAPSNPSTDKEKNRAGNYEQNYAGCG